MVGDTCNFITCADNAFNVALPAQKKPSIYWRLHTTILHYITPLIVARAGYFLIISLTGMAVLKMSFLRIGYVASIRAFIFSLSWLLTCFEVSFSNSTKCSSWIAAVVFSADGTTFQKSNLRGILVFGCFETHVSVLDWQETADAFRFLMII